MKIDVTRLRSMIREAAAELHLLGEADDPKPTKTRDKTRSDVEDLFEPREDEPLAVPPPPAGQRQQRPRGAPVRRDIPLPEPGAVGHASSMLAGDVDPEFDFDSEFERGLEREPADDLGVAVGPEPEDDEFERHHPAGGGMPPEPKPKKLTGGDYLEPLEHKPQHFEDPAEEILKVLMREFVSPAMAVGQRVLPSVWMELRRLMMRDPRRLSAQLSAALNQIRELENHWFAGLLNIEPPPVMMQPAEGPDKAMREAIVHALEKYYKTVLAAAGDNSEELVMALDAIRRSVGEATFQEAFFQALQKTRDVEDAAFAGMM